MKKPEHHRIRIYDFEAHRELAQAFPALASRLESLLMTEIRIECPNGHRLTALAQLVAAGREVFCPYCRQAFRPVPDGAVKVPSGMRQTDEPAGDSCSNTAVLPLPPGGPVRQGLSLVSSGLVMMAGHLLRGLMRRRGKLRRFLGSSGGWAFSTAVHAGLLLLAMLVGVRLRTPLPEAAAPLMTDLQPEPPRDIVEQREKPRDIFRKVHEIPAAEEIPMPEVEVAAPFETPEAREDIPLAPGPVLPDQEIAMVPPGLMMPASARAIPAVMGVAATAPAGSYVLRGDGGARLKAAERGGGGPDTESAVERALAWLARNQDGEGFWDLNGRKEGATQPTLRPALTGMAVLAFLGAGYTHKGAHRYSPQVSRAITWLMNRQERDGGWTGLTTGCCYSHAIATLALAEACAMGGTGTGAPDELDRRLRAAAQSATDWAVRAQNPYAGWDYRPRGGTSDTSITVWNCMALKAARAAGLRVDGAAFQGIVNWLNSAQNMSGSGTGPDWAGGQFAYRGRPGSRSMARGTLMTVMHAAGLMMRLMTDTPPDRRETRGVANLLLGMIPREVSGEEEKARIAELAEAHIRKYYMTWDGMTPEEQRRVRAAAERAVAAQPRSVDDYIARNHGAAWQRMTEGQRVAIRETARQVMEKQPQTAEEYIDRNYRKWEIFTDEERELARAEAARLARAQVLGGEFPPSIYFLYHSSLALFQVGDRHWQQWNAAMKKALLPLQVQGGADDGAFSERGTRSGMMTCNGMTMATALSAMTLEVYYRYLRIHEMPPATNR